MNVRDFVLSRGVDEEPGEMAEAYIKEVLALPDEEERIAALLPAVRQLVSTQASSLRKAQRGPSWTWPAPGKRPVRAPRGHDEPIPPQAPAGGNGEHFLAWLRQHDRQRYFIPGTGRKLMVDITADEWDARAGWFEQMARGALAEAKGCHNMAAFLRESGVRTARELLRHEEEK